MASPSGPKRPPPPRAFSESDRMGQQAPFTVDVKELEAAKIRWFYLEIGAKNWTPFNGYDSLALEHARMVVTNSNDPDSSQEVTVIGDMYTVDLYQYSASLKAIYWDLKEPWVVRRGVWFETNKDQWVPIPEEEVEIIEEAHRRTDWREKAKADADLSAWAKAKSQATPTSQQQGMVILHQVMLKNYEVVWIGDNEVLKVKKDLTSRVLGIVGEKLGSKGLYGSMRIHRGYKEHALFSDCMSKIGHLVFAIHGIGQNMDSSDIVKSTDDFRETCTQVAKKHFPDKWKDRRIEFIPIEWRTWLTLDKGTLRSITPHSVKAIRNIINDSVLDIMYYMSPKYGPELLDGFRFQLNKKFTEFTRRHPSFLQDGGTVSFFGHSLGSVMCYDLMCETCEAKGLVDKRDSIPVRGLEREEERGGGVLNDGGSIPKQQPTDTTGEEERDGGEEDIVMTDEQFEELHKARVRVVELEQQLIKKKALCFDVDHFFAVGSPLGIFVMLKEQDNTIKKHFKGAESFLPSCICRRIHNLHHPSDPVAYRIEPLVNPLYSQIKPVKVDSAGGKPSQKSKDHAEGPRPQDEPSPSASRGWFNMASSVLKGLGSNATPTTEATRLPENKIFDDDSKLKPEERLQERLDFMLRESFTENSYINAITAHLCYWTSNDTAMYLLLQIYTYQKESSKL